MTFLRLLFVTSIVAALFSGTAASTSNLSETWELISEPVAAKSMQQAWVQPDKFATYKLTPASLLSDLEGAPMEKDGAKLADAGFQIQIPTPDNSFQTFHVVESPIMESELAAKYPDIRTYRGQGVDDPSATLRFDWTPAGFHASVISSEGSYYIDPLFKENVEIYAAYHRQDSGCGETWSCHVTDEDSGFPGSLTPQKSLTSAGTHLRTFRLACAATGEYTEFHGGTVKLGLAAMVTCFNRVNQIYENDLATRLILVGKNNKLIYTKSDSDPYTNIASSVLLNENLANVDEVIGSANYDIGHVLCTAPGGLAGLGVVCGSQKARGLTGLSNPTGDPFHVDYVAHEVGHQFNARHTFNGRRNSCSGGNRIADTAVEPRSGSTIMAYAGICGFDNLQSNSNPYFHGVSVETMNDFISNATCKAESGTGNTVPSVEAGTNYLIPKLTPFTLTASGSDAESNDLTYCWEQVDLGPARYLQDPDNGLSPLFRSYTPVSSPSRTFPRLSAIIANVSNAAEQLPTMQREAMKFRVTARDNQAGGGGMAFDEMQLQVVGTAGPFAVTAPNAYAVYSGDLVVTWDVANTNQAPLNTSMVDIYLSADGGNTFPTLLANDTPNDGSESVPLPSINMNQARIKVAATNSVYWDMSNASFEISDLPACLTSGNVTTMTLQDIPVTIELPIGPSANPLTVEIIGQPENGVVVVNPDNTVTYTPNTVHYGYDWFEYRATDGSCGSPLGTVIIWVDKECFAGIPSDAAGCSALPDLTAGWHVAPEFKCNKKGKCKIKAQALVTNEGQAIAPAFDVKLYYSSDTCLDQNDLELRSYTVKNLKPGKSKKLGLTPKDLAAIPQADLGYIIFLVNGNAAVVECNGTNNLSVAKP